MASGDKILKGRLGAWSEADNGKKIVKLLPPLFDFTVGFNCREMVRLNGCKMPWAFVEEIMSGAKRRGKGATRSSWRLVDQPILRIATPTVRSWLYLCAAWTSRVWGVG